jgi:diacylglycerol O-acyltransferase
VNELVMAALSGGLRHVLAAAGERVDGLEPRALVPVNTRAPGNEGLGNAFGLVFLDLPVRLPTAVERLAAVRDRFLLLKQSPDAVVVLTMLGAFGLMPTPLEQLGLSFFSRKASLVVTNVAGPRAPLHLAGHALDRMMFWVPHPATLNLGVSVFSYAGTVRVGVRSDVAALPDPSVLSAAIEEELRGFGVEVPTEARVRRSGASAGGRRGTLRRRTTRRNGVNGTRAAAPPAAPVQASADLSPADVAPAEEPLAQPLAPLPVPELGVAPPERVAEPA